jgi:DNA polymerase-3 subunit alpha
MQTVPKIVYNDQHAFDLISKGDNIGIFQLSGSTGISELATQIKPQTIEDIAVILAIYRPGPLQNNVHIEYVACRNGKQPTYLHSFLEPLLKDTYGKILYQEQVIKICMSVGFSEVEADTIRKMMGKKQPELLKDLEPKFIKKCSDITGQYIAKKLWDEICNCSGYLFGLSHAIGYATLTYITAYLKANYPLEFYTALLNNENKPQKLQEIISDTDITILPPRYNKSEMNFKIEGDTIRYGLKGIYGIGEKDSQKILELGKELLNKDSTLSQTLIHGGFFDDINPNRQQLFSSLTTKRKRSLFEIKDYTDTQKNQYEFELLHVFLKDNPLRNYDIISYTGNDLKDSTEILAIIQNITVLKNKKGNKYSKIDIINCNNVTHKLYIFSNDFNKIKLEKNSYYLLTIRQYEDIFYIKGAKKL